MISIDLSGGLVLVTGGAGSIGRAIATQAAQAGASIAVCDTNIEEVEAVAAQIRTNGAVAKSFEMDVTDLVVVKKVMDSAVKELGPLRGLVTAAGVLRTGPLSSQSHEDFRPAAFDVCNLVIGAPMPQAATARHSPSQAGKLSVHVSLGSRNKKLHNSTLIQ